MQHKKYSYQLKIKTYLTKLSADLHLKCFNKHITSNKWKAYKFKCLREQYDTYTNFPIFHLHFNTVKLIILTSRKASNINPLL